MSVRLTSASYAAGILTLRGSGFNFFNTLPQDDGQIGGPLPWIVDVWAGNEDVPSYPGATSLSDYHVGGVVSDTEISIPLAADYPSQTITGLMAVSLGWGPYDASSGSFYTHYAPEFILTPFGSDVPTVANPWWLRYRDPIAGTPGVLTQSFVADIKEATDHRWTADPSLASELPIPTGVSINPMTTVGDLVVGGAAGVETRLGVGADSSVLTISPSTHLPVWLPDTDLAPPVTITGTNPATVPLTVVGAAGQTADVMDITGPSTGHPSVLIVTAGAEQTAASGDDFVTFLNGNGQNVFNVNTQGTVGIAGKQPAQLALDVTRASGGSVDIARFHTNGSGAVEVGPAASLSVTTDSGSVTPPLAIMVPGGGSTLLALTSTGALTLGATTTVQDDLVVGGASGALSILNKGTDGQVLSVDATTHHLKWNTPAAAPAFATPAIVLGTAAAAGAASTVIRSDATVVAFDATAPVTQAFSDAAATGSAAVAARRDHKHGMPANPVSFPLTAAGDETFQPNGVASSTLTLHNPALAAVGVTINGNVSGGIPQILASGTGTDIGLIVGAKGAGTISTQGRYAVGADVTGSRNITAGSNTNGSNRRRVIVTATLVGAAAGTVELTYTTTVGGTTLTAVHGPKASVAFTGNYQMAFAVDPGASYSVNTVTTGTGASATLVQWIEVDE